MRHELSPHSKLKNSLTQGLDRFEGGVEVGEVVADAVPGGLGGSGIAGLGERVVDGADEALVGLFAGLAR